MERRDPSFFPGGTPFLWRGPTWAFNNWFLYRTFKARGLHEQAQNAAASTVGLVEKNGFREYYDPLLGQGQGARDFTWSGLLVDMD